MCGICGWYGRHDRGVVTRMINAIRHRGPDGDGVAIVGGHTLGAVRLNIFGGQAAGQPWVQDGLGVVFNGEIYNFTELRAELEEAGISTPSGGEPELLANIYRQHGIDFARKLRGMFAVAVVDARRDLLVLARDRFGIKPLYYSQQAGELAFASEIKALLQADAATAVLDEEALGGLVTFGYVFDPQQTLFRSVYQIEPGTVAVFDGRSLATSRYYERPPARRVLTWSNAEFVAAAEGVRNVLTTAVQVHGVHGAQDKAFYLSGGMDSSFMAAIAARQSRRPIVTYTLADDESSEDLQYARRVAAAIGSEHREVRVNLNSYLQALPDYVYHYEHFVAGGAFDLHGGIAFHILSQEIANDFKVAFSGEGADELFGGYYWTYTHPLGFAERIRNRLSSAGVNGSVAAAVQRLFPQPADAWEYRQRLLDWLMGSALSNYHLCSVDRSCGAFGFEIRPVYLDSQLAEEALRLPAEFKLGADGLQTKVVLKEAARPLFRELGIEGILNRKKLGMPWAVHNLEADINAWADRVITDSHIAHHPFRQYIAGKLEAVLFDLFFHIFFARRGTLEHSFDVQEYFASGAHERLYS